MNLRRLINKLLGRSFDAAKSTSWRKQPIQIQSGQAAVEAGGAKLRAWARYLDENHDLAIGVLDVLVANICPLTVQPMVRRKNGNPADTINKQIIELWDDWIKAPEVTGELSFAEVQRLACRAWLRDGEVLLQHVIGDRPDLDHNTTVPYSIEMIESDYLPYDMIGGDNLVAGIEVNAWGRPVAYNLLKSHPGDTSGRYITLSDTKRIPADLIEHIKFVRRFHQSRGQSILHGVITRLDDVKDYEESERIAARVAAAFTGYIKRSADYQSAMDANGDRTFEMNPGMIFDNLLPGEEVGTIGSDRPNTGLQDFRNSMLRAIASGTGTSYSSISKDYSGTYSSQRQEMQESQPGYKRMREYFISAFLRPVYERFIFSAQAAGQLPRSPMLDMTAVEFGGVSLPWIDPAKEADAFIKLMDANLRSRHQIIKEMGYDPRIVDEQIEADPMKAERIAEQQTEEKPEAKPEDKAEEKPEEAAA